MQRHDSLSQAVQATDLPALIAQLYPQSQCVPGKPGLFFAAWRGNDQTPALSLSKKQNVWLWHDHATGEGGNAFDFLVGPHGMGRQEAAHFLLERAGIPLDAPAEGTGGQHLRPVASDAADRLSALRTGVPIEALKGRGFTAAIVERYGIREQAGDALIPITSPEGVVMQVKRRLHGKQGSGKYRYEFKGHGSPAWCSPGSRQAPTLLIVEGELNAIIAHASLQAEGEVSLGVMGMAGAKTDLYPGLVHGKHVFIYADDDEAGASAKETWADKARDQGARTVHIMPSFGLDFCDYAGSRGRSDLAAHVAQLMADADQRYGAVDRMLAGGSVRDYLRSAEQFVHGGVIHATGLRYLDKEVGGIRESGVYSVAALSTMGKSALLRRMLLEHVRRGGMVRLYSPDQSARTVYRLLASLLSGVGLTELRTRQFDDATIKLYGDPDRATKEWVAVHEYVIHELSQRFQVTEEGEADVIFDDMERAVDQGVTMFGIDYLQSIEPRDHRDRDGLVASELRKLSHRIGAPVLSALQLAKYKYPPSRVSGVPVPSDIEGSGKYYQDSEMVMMLYNEAVYEAKYAGENFEPVNLMDDEARVYIVKDKEGIGNGQFEVRWDSRLVTYYDNLQPWDLRVERLGLL